MRAHTHTTRMCYTRKRTLATANGHSAATECVYLRPERARAQSAAQLQQSQNNSFARARTRSTSDVKCAPARSIQKKYFWDIGRTQCPGVRTWCIQVHMQNMFHVIVRPRHTPYGPCNQHYSGIECAVHVCVCVYVRASDCESVPPQIPGQTKRRTMLIK